ncbi:MAG: uroporphyrinogen-III C-methyltransferase [Pseudomonadota bacterium]
MSENDNETDAEFPAEDSEAPRIEVEEQKPAKSWRKTAIKWLIVLVLLGALGAFGYWKFMEWRAADEPAVVDTAPNEVEALRDELRLTREAVTALQAQVEGIQHPDFSGDISAVRRDVDDQLALLNSLPSRMTTLENSVASLAGISEGARETFLLSEAEYYMQIANAQLQLANNPELAMLALQMADERVSQLADPGLTAVRRAVSDELAALEVMEKPDLEGATLTLSSLARVVESLPLASDQSNEATDEALSDEERGALERAWSSTKEAMSGLVKVTPPEQAQLAIISPDAEQFLRNNIALQLQAARLALLRGENAIFMQSLDDASDLLTAYFDTNSEQVGAALQTIDDVREGVFTTTPPDISGSLRQLRQYRTLNETAE